MTGNEGVVQIRAPAQQRRNERREKSRFFLFFFLLNAWQRRSSSGCILCEGGWGKKKKTTFMIKEEESRDGWDAAREGAMRATGWRERKRRLKNICRCRNKTHTSTPSSPLFPPTHTRTHAHTHLQLPPSGWRCVIWHIHFQGWVCLRRCRGSCKPPSGYSANPGRVSLRKHTRWNANKSLPVEQLPPHNCPIFLPLALLVSGCLD